MFRGCFLGDASSNLILFLSKSNSEFKISTLGAGYRINCGFYCPRLEGGYCLKKEHAMFSVRFLIRHTGLLVTLVISHLSFATSWHDIDEPYPNPPEAIGIYTNGCLAGAQAMPFEGKGFQVIRASRNRYYGHPKLIKFVQDLGTSVNADSGKDLLIADMSMPRGGTFRSGHASHQIGLDVDVWFRQVDKSFSTAQRETPYSVNLVDQELFKVNTHWQNNHASMIRLAASDPRVARVFVNPVIKQQLCKMSWKDDNWLNKVRPWWGHASHMHVRLTCPEDDTLCRNQMVPADGNGCNEIAWWKKEMAKPKEPQSTASKKKPAKVKPQQCEPLLATTG